jgi:hypothetical protein
MGRLAVRRERGWRHWTWSLIRSNFGASPIYPKSGNIHRETGFGGAVFVTMLSPTQRLVGGLLPAERQPQRHLKFVALRDDEMSVTWVANCDHQRPHLRRISLPSIPTLRRARKAVLSAFVDPIVLAKNVQSMSWSFVKTARRDFDSMFAHRSNLDRTPYKSEAPREVLLHLFERRIDTRFRDRAYHVEKDPATGPVRSLPGDTARTQPVRATSRGPAGIADTRKVTNPRNGAPGTPATANLTAAITPAAVRS